MGCGKGRNRVSPGKRLGCWSLLASVSGTGPPLGSSRVSGVVFLISQRKTSVISETHVGQSQEAGVFIFHPLTMSFILHPLNPEAYLRHPLSRTESCFMCPLEVFQRHHLLLSSPTVITNHPSPSCHHSSSSHDDVLYPFSIL